MDIPTFYQVLVVSPLLHSTASFLAKSRGLQLSVRVITFFKKTTWLAAHSTECSS